MRGVVEGLDAAEEGGFARVVEAEEEDGVFCGSVRLGVLAVVLFFGGGLGVCGRGKKEGEEGQRRGGMVEAGLLAFFAGCVEVEGFGEVVHCQEEDKEGRESGRSRGCLAR